MYPICGPVTVTKHPQFKTSYYFSGFWNCHNKYTRRDCTTKNNFLDFIRCQVWGISILLNRHGTCNWAHTLLKYMSQGQAKHSNNGTLVGTLNLVQFHEWTKTPVAKLRLGLSVSELILVLQMFFLGLQPFIMNFNGNLYFRGAKFWFCIHTAF